MARREKEQPAPIRPTVTADDLCQRALQALTRRIGLNGSIIPNDTPIIVAQGPEYPGDPFSITPGRIEDEQTQPQAEIHEVEEKSTPIQALVQELADLSYQTSAYDLSLKAQKDLALDTSTITFLHTAATFLDEAEGFDTSSLWSDTHALLTPGISDESMAQKYQVAANRALELVKLSLAYANSDEPNASLMKAAFEQVVVDMNKITEEQSVPSIVAGAILLRTDLDYSVENLIELVSKEGAPTRVESEPTGKDMVVGNVSGDAHIQIDDTTEKATQIAPIKKRWNFLKRLFPWFFRG